ncbi:MAG: HPr family phosphocarrier protein [Planctomycetaceae bacterium]
MSATPIAREVVIVNPQGLHARPAHQVVKTAMQFRSQVRIVKGKDSIDAKSILDLLTLGAGNGTKLRLEASGDDAQEAVDALAQLVEHGFGELKPETQE